MAAHWVDLVDPTREELLYALPAYVDPEVVELLLAQPDAERQARPLLESHGAYAFGVFVALRHLGDGRVDAQEVDFIATPELLVTVRKTAPGGSPLDPGVLQPAHEEEAAVGVLVHRLIDEVADSYLDFIDAVYARIDEFEDRIDELRTGDIRARLLEARHMLLLRRRMVSATREAVRRILDGRVEVGNHALFPPEVEQLFGDTYDTLVRATEELDIARDLLAGARDHLQAKIAETQNDIAKKLTVIASLVLVPSFITGFYGQNFDNEFQKGYWTLGVAVGLIVASTIVQLVLFRWRRWI
jgi:Mg2+ and Co2+ transporter CorA